MTLHSLVLKQYVVSIAINKDKPFCLYEKDWYVGKCNAQVFKTANDLPTM